MAASIFSLSSIAIGFSVAYIVYRIAITTLTSITAHRFSKANNCGPVWRYPGAPIVPFLKVLQSTRRGTYTEFIASWFRPGQYTLSVPLVPFNIMATAEPENIKAVLSSNFLDYSLGTTRISIWDLLGRGIFTTDGEEWQHSRNLLRPQFTRSRVDGDVEHFDRDVTLLLDSWLPEGIEVDLMPLFYKLTLDSSTAFLFGESTGSLKTSEANEFGAAFEAAQLWAVWKSRLPNFLQLYTPKKMREANATCHKFVDHYVQLALKRRREELKKSANYVFLEAVAEDTQDPKELRDQMLNVLLAGRDTTAAVLGFTFFLLARRSDVVRKLREELESTFGTGEPGGWKRPDFESLKSCVYLRYVLNEVLRLYPVVPHNIRLAERNTALPLGGGPDGKRPVFVPKGTRVLYSSYVVQRRRDIYGEDADEFRPERWGEGVVRPWAYLPFNGGPRICLGRE
jgi:cytochrome P450